MSRFRLSHRASADIRAIWDYIGVAKDDPTAAHRQVETLLERLQLLATHPLMGQSREDLRSGLRTFAAGNYVILYYPMTDGIRVAGVVHGAREMRMTRIGSLPARATIAALVGG